MTFLRRCRGGGRRDSRHGRHGTRGWRTSWVRVRRIRANTIAATPRDTARIDWILADRASSA